MKKVLLICFLFLAEITSGQSPYQLSWKQDAALLGGGFISIGLGRYLTKNTTPFQIQEVYALDRSMVNGFDRTATYNHSHKAADFSNIMLSGSHFLPAVLLIGKKSRSDIGRLAILYGEAYLLTAGITLITKSTVLRTRPFVYNETFSQAVKLSENARFSFFSGHSSIAAVNSFFLAKVFSDYYPDSKLKPLVWGIAITVPAATAYARVAAGKHYPSDVIIGYAVGAAIGILVPQLHKSRNIDQRITYSPGLGGGRLVWKF